VFFEVEDWCHGLFCDVEDCGHGVFSQVENCRCGLSCGIEECWRREVSAVTEFAIILKGRKGWVSTYLVVLLGFRILEPSPYVERIGILGFPNVRAP
jgi:hypothetical protein